MNLEFLMSDFKERAAKLEQVAYADSSDPAWGIKLCYCAKDVQITAKYIARLSRRCKNLQEHYPEDV